MPGRRDASIFMSQWHGIPVVAGAGNEIDWALVLGVRQAVSRVLERLRKEERIGGSLDAEVQLFADGEMFDKLSALGDELRFALIVSSASVKPAAGKPVDAVMDEDVPGLWMVADKSTHEKCVRCWHRRPDVGQHAEHPELCDRCIENVAGNGEQRVFA